LFQHISTLINLLRTAIVPLKQLDFTRFRRGVYLT